MEEIKVSPNVEFEVIYADGERKRVQEGLLFGVEEDGSMILHNGTDDAVVWFAAANAMLVALNTCDAMPKFVLTSLTETQSFHALKKLAEEIHRRIWLKTPATFRLGQMDVLASIRDMLMDAANETADESRYGLIVASNMIATMEVPNADN